MKVLVLTISDRASAGQYEDRSGPAAEKLIRSKISEADVHRAIVPDEPAEIRKAFESNLFCDCIITTGGTGISPRDITPEVTQSFCDRLIPGITEILRSESYKQTPHAMLSRGVAGIKGNTVIVNLPGSVKAVEFCLELLLPVLMHGLEMMKGKGH